MTDFDRVVSMLEKAGYSPSEEDPPQMGHFEYVAANASGKRIISFGPGRSGDEMCYTNLYFTLDSGEFIEHASNNDDS